MTTRQFSIPTLYAIANIDTLADPLSYIEALFAGSIEIVQLRAKQTLDADYDALLAKTMALRARYPAARVIVNDSVPRAKRYQADGVHLGQEDADPVQARSVLGAQAIIGLSTHTLAQLAAAPVEALSYLAVGPVFASPTKSGHATVIGAAALASFRAETSLPLVAIGGVTLENAAAVFSSGFDSVAIISDLQASLDVRGYRGKIERIKNDSLNR